MDAMQEFLARKKAEIEADVCGRRRIERGGPRGWLPSTIE
jgi:hypothetical protein